MAEDGVRSIVDALPRVMRTPGVPEASAALLYGAWLCGFCLGMLAMGLHHKLCHTLGGLFDLPHAQTHAIVLPYALACNEPMIPRAGNIPRSSPMTRRRVNYLLSKRTMVYTSVGYMFNSVLAANPVAVAGTVGTGMDQRGVMVGLQQKF